MVLASQVGAQKSRNPLNKKLIIAFVLVLIIGIALLAVFLKIEIDAAFNSSSRNSASFPQPFMESSLIGQELLTFKNAQYFVPFGLVAYNSNNVNLININASIYDYPEPRFIYILNVSDQCISCGNSDAIETSMYTNLVKYNIVQNTSDIFLISISNIKSLPPDSILVILNGLLPSQLLGPSGSGNTTILDYLLNEHTSILYVGQNFSRVVQAGGLAVPPNQLAFPLYLDTVPRTVNTLKLKNPPFYFTNATFSFETNNSNYSTMTYENVYNGSIVAISNYPDVSPPNQTGHDLATAIQKLFWLPRLAQGSRTVHLSASAPSSGDMGVLLNSLKVPLNSTYVSAFDNGQFRIAITANSTYSYGYSNSSYTYIRSNPLLYYNGSIGLGNSIVINQTVPFSFNISTGSQNPISLTLHMQIYNLNMTPVTSAWGPSGTPLPPLLNVMGNVNFSSSERMLLAPNTSYIIKLSDFSGKEYAAAYFNTTPITITPISANLTTDGFVFSITSARQPLNNINYTMELNNLYPSTGIIKHGFLNYSVPKGTPTIRGTLNFSVNILGKNTYYVSSYNPLPFGVSEQYIEIAVVVIFMIAMIVLVRAPNRDEFYIDVPNLPEEPKTKIMMKPDDFMSVFDKLNNSYHWRYMPLSKAEIKAAIASNIKISNIPVSLTYNNIEKLLDQLTVRNYLVSVDSLYAPVQWMNQSKHDIEYLATFKKLRLYLVTHAFIFTDLDMSSNSDIVATLHNERKYIVIYSKTSKYEKMPIYTGSKTYLAFLNSYRMEEFKNSLYNSTNVGAEELKMYIDAGFIKLVDADNPQDLMQ
ncbi:MAG: hypothetical protein ABR981_02380 [Candidatus Micrarchaeaceae archaeon]